MPSGVKTERKLYLGDGVYVGICELGLVLTTENGVETTNTIVLEPEVYEALALYVARLKVKKEE